jgi:uncharacterized membrane protein
MRQFKLVMKYLLAIFFVGAGVNHFIKPEFYLRIMPPYLPLHRELVYLSGLCEVALGVMVLIPKWTRLAGLGLIALLIAVYPANIHMAINHHLYPDIPMIFHWIRLPLQFVFMAWAWWATKDDK